MKLLELEKASKPLAEYASDLGTDALLITSKNEPVAALVSIKDADRESLALALSPEFAKIIRRARKEAKGGQVFTLDQVKEEIGRKKARSRATALHRNSAHRKPSKRA